LEPPVRPIQWHEDAVRILDQRKLPEEERYIDITGPAEMADAIKTMALRGAPLIGIAAAMGVAVEARSRAGLSWGSFKEHIAGAIDLLSTTRPTAGNLFWALRRMKGVLEAGSEKRSPRECAGRLVDEALAVYEEDLETGRRMGRIGVELLKAGCSVLTHCNAGGLATSGFGTALAPLYMASRQGIGFKVFADETRPLLQGARLTAWELSKAGIDVTVICDSASHLLMSRGEIDLVLVGADRITSRGDFANKIGTRGVAVSARYSGVPLYVVAPTSTIDFNLERGEDIPIEERESCEVTSFAGVVTAPAGVRAYNPAFDVTPQELVSGIITEKGLLKPPFASGIASIRPAGAQMR
jgi:methylthioribose-1-phosphate isomerase